MSESNNCCEKCDAEMWDGPKGKCYNDTCPCHSTTPDTEWEKEVREEWDRYNNGKFCSLDCTIDFIAHLITSRDTYWKEQLQNARIDWLRSEIKKLEGVKTNYVQGMENGLLHHREPCQCQTCVDERNVTLTSVITRYKEELLELEKWV